MTLVKRIVKGAPLTHVELDGNFDHVIGLVNAIGSKNNVLNGSGVPGVGLGQAGDFYIDSTNYTIYGPKTTVWGAGTSMITAILQTQALTTLWVSPNGNNATGAKGVINRPYLTIAAAIAAAVAGDTIVIWTGDYTAAGKIAMKNGVNLFCMQGVKLRGINCTASAIATVEGWAEIVSNLGAPDETNAAIYVDTSARLIVRCRSIACTGTAQALLVTTGGYLDLEVEENITHSGATYALLQQYASTGNGTFCKIVADAITSTGSGQNIIVCFASSDASCRSFTHVKARRMSSASGVNFVMSHGGFSGTLGQIMVLVEVDYNICNNGLMYNINSRNDATNLNMLLHIKGGLHVSKLNHVLRQGFSSGRMASVKIIGATFITDWNNAAAACIRFENVNGNNGETILANSTMISTFGTNTMTASNASAGLIIGNNTNGLNKAVDANCAVTGIAFTVAAAIKDTTIQIPII